MGRRKGLERTALLAVCITGLVACSDDGGDKQMDTLDGSLRNDAGSDARIDGGPTVFRDAELPDGASSDDGGFGIDGGEVACSASCNDNVDCTVDSCVNGACQHRIDNGACGAGSSCNLTMGCQQGKSCANDMDCADMDGCTTNPNCNQMVGRCEYDVLDRDGDGYAPPSCGGKDCDDARGLVSPSGTETCNGRDDDCDGMIDEGLQLAAGNACVNGRPECAQGYERCGGPGGACINVQTDPANCGGCLNICDSGESCTMGECTCNTGGSVMMCGGPADRCADLTKSEFHCGGCGDICLGNGPLDAQACINGACEPCGGENQVCCDNVGIAQLPLCLPGLTCEGGAGAPGSKCTCAAGSTKCGNACVDLKTSRTNCGMCGNACDPDETCVTAGGASTCQACGGLGERCCAPLDLCTGGLVCGPDDTCVASNAGSGPG
jgi:hypothetical protein